MRTFYRLLLIGAVLFTALGLLWLIRAHPTMLGLDLQGTSFHLPVGVLLAFVFAAGVVVGLVLAWMGRLWSGLRKVFKKSNSR